jgi:hypothetical protein
MEHIPYPSPSCPRQMTFGLGRLLLFVVAVDADAAIALLLLLLLLLRMLECLLKSQIYTSELGPRVETIK